ncbi:MAG: hypothetical protein IKZ47_03625 [Clostridia bacterium]|nr:hypothetical protein [Clostridia bacterium]
MAKEKNKKKKLLIIILSAALAVLIAAGGTVWYFVAIYGKNEPVKTKKKGLVILTEEEVDEPDDIIEDIDIEPDDQIIDFIDEDDFEDVETPQIITLKNSASVNDKFMGFGAIYYPWIYLNDDAGRNYTEQQRQIELDRLVTSGVTWIRSMIYARSEWYNKSANTWNYSGEHYEGLVKFFKEIDKRGIEVLLNFEWGGAIQPDSNGNMTIFNDSTLSKIGTMDDRIAMYGDFCTTFTKKLKEDGVNCIKYITFFSEPANRRQLGGQYGTEEFDSIFLAKIVPAYTKIIKTVHDDFTAAGIRQDYRFVGNNQSSYYYINLYTWQQLKPLYDPVKEYLDEYDYHFYNRLSNPKGATYDDFSIIPETFAEDVEKYMGINANDTWIDEFNILHNGASGGFSALTQQYGGIYSLKDEPYTATQMGNTLLAFLNNGYKTAGVWTFINTLWPNSTQTGGEFDSGLMLDGLMPNLMDSQVPYNAYYTYSMIARYCNNAKSVYACDMDDAEGLAASCVYDKDGTVTIFVVNSNLYEVEFKMDFEKEISGSVFYRHLYDPETFESDTSAKPIGVDRALIHVTGGFADRIPAGAVVVYTTSKK